MACEILVPWPGIEPKSPSLQGGFLTTEPSGKSLVSVLVFFFAIYSSQRLEWSIVLILDI